MGQATSRGGSGSGRAARTASSAALLLQRLGDGFDDLGLNRNRFSAGVRADNPFARLVGDASQLLEEFCDLPVLCFVR